MIVVKLTHHTHLTKTQPKVHVGKCVINIVYLESVIVKEEDGLTARESFASKNKFYLKKTKNGIFMHILCFKACKLNSRTQLLPSNNEESKAFDRTRKL